MHGKRFSRSFRGTEFENRRKYSCFSFQHLDFSGKYVISKEVFVILIDNQFNQKEKQ